MTSFKSHIPLSDLSLPWTLPDTQLPEDLSGRWGRGGAHRALVRGCAPEKRSALEEEGGGESLSLRRVSEALLQLPAVSSAPGSR